MNKVTFVYNKYTNVWKADLAGRAGIYFYYYSFKKNWTFIPTTARIVGKDPRVVKYPDMNVLDYKSQFQALPNTECIPLRGGDVDQVAECIVVTFLTFYDCAAYVRENHTTATGVLYRASEENNCCYYRKEFKGTTDRSAVTTYCFFFLMWQQNFYNRIADYGQCELKASVFAKYHICTVNSSGDVDALLSSYNCSDTTRNYGTALGSIYTDRKACCSVFPYNNDRLYVVCCTGNGYFCFVPKLLPQLQRDESVKEACYPYVGTDEATREEIDGTFRNFYDCAYVVKHKPVADNYIGASFNSTSKKCYGLTGFFGKHGNEDFQYCYFDYKIRGVTGLALLDIIDQYREARVAKYTNKRIDETTDLEFFQYKGKVVLERAKIATEKATYNNIQTFRKSKEDENDAADFLKLLKNRKKEDINAALQTLELAFLKDTSEQDREKEKNAYELLISTENIYNFPSYTLSVESLMRDATHDLATKKALFVAARENYIRTAIPVDDYINRNYKKAVNTGSLSHITQENKKFLSNVRNLDEKKKKFINSFYQEEFAERVLYYSRILKENV